MSHPRPFVRLWFIFSMLVAAILPHTHVVAATGTTSYISFRKHTTAANFAGSTGAGVIVKSAGAGVELRLASTGLKLGADKKQYAKRYWYGTLESPAVEVTPSFNTAIPSWNAVTPAGTWLQMELRAYRASDNHWTKYYNLGRWASGAGTIKRQSVNGQRDANGTVASDTLRLSGAAAYTQYQYRLTLFTANQRITPTVSLIAVMTADDAKQPNGLALTSDQEAWGKDLNVPQRSQMIYKGGGQVWCSPTSTSMVLAYWGKNVPVPEAAAATYDYVYRGNGNWPFNTAWASTHGFEAVVTRMASFAQVEEWISAGVPVIMSYAMNNRELGGTPYGSTSGHIMVIRGFDQNGDVIVNDPAFGSNETVRAVYHRDTLERLWLQHSGGTVYLIYPKGWAIPTDKAHGSW